MARNALCAFATISFLACYTGPAGGALFSEHMKRGQAALDQGLYSKAHIAFQQALSLQPGNEDAFLSTQLAAAAVAALEPARINDTNINELDYAVDTLQPRYPKFAHLLWTTRGNILARAGHQDDAIAAYRKALDARQDFVPALVYMADVLRTSGKSTEAEAALRQAIKADAKNQAAHEALAVLLANRKDYTEAAAVIREALASGGSARLNDLLGQVSVAAGNWPNAEEAFRNSLAGSPNDAGGLAGMGQVYLQQNRLDDARAMFARYLEVAPQQGESSERIAEIRNAVARLAASAPAPGGAVEPPGATHVVVLPKTAAKP